MTTILVAQYCVNGSIHTAHVDFNAKKYPFAVATFINKDDISDFSESVSFYRYEKLEEMVDAYHAKTHGSIRQANFTEKDGEINKLIEGVSVISPRVIDSINNAKEIHGDKLIVGNLSREEVIDLFEKAGHTLSAEQLSRKTGATACAGIAALLEKEGSVVYLNTHKVHPISNLQYVTSCGNFLTLGQNEGSFFSEFYLTITDRKDNKHV